MLAGSFLERSYRKALHRFVVNCLAAYPIRPDWITGAGLAVCGVAGALAPWSPAVAGLLLLVAGFLDTLDGELSRATGQASPAGALLDSTLDRYAEFAALAGAWGRLSRLGHAGGSALLAFAALQGSLMVSYARARAESLGVQVRGGFFERAERVLVLAAGLLASPFDGTAGLPEGSFLAAALVVLAIGANATALGRTVRARRALSSPK
ncbi:MAG: CDP-alcohol phosphatidyltransferase family protein [Deltaproteobacteria bacterium]|nr:CDP-alcohol phosphatidyltransferase family protein [Deltaproteobacteria bacterium]